MNKQSKNPEEKEFKASLGDSTIGSPGRLNDVFNRTGIPVIFGVLTTDNLQQALERAGIKSNLGWSYALQALEMGSLMYKVNALKQLSSLIDQVPVLRACCS